MAQYIDKDALVAEIERLKGSLSPNFYEYDYDAAKVELLEKIEEFLDSFEVKEIGVDLGDPKGDKSAEYIIDTKTLEVKEVDFELIIGWFDHIAQIADDRMTLTNHRMSDSHALDEIKCIAKNSSEFITKHYKAQKGEEV